MSNKKVSELTELTDPSPDDVLPILDISASELKKVKVSEIGGVSGSSDVKVQKGSQVANIAGTVVTFPEAFADTNYGFQPYGQLAGVAVNVNIGTVSGGTKTTTTITVYPDADGTTVNWIAVGT